jgi:hypothetical protein
MATRPLVTPFALALLCAIPITQAAFSKEFSESDFRETCIQAISHDARALEWFDRGDPLRMTDNYSIQVLRVKSPNRSGPLQVQLLLDRGTDKDAEIPKFAGICLDSILPIKFLGFTPPSASVPSGDIDFHSKGHPSVTLSFVLTGLPHTTWHRTNGTGNDSVWMVRFSGNPPPSPGPHDWPCRKKKVTIDDTNKMISFVMCHAITPWAHQYQYALHMQQIGNDQLPVDIGIDPRIVDHPN